MRNQHAAGASPHAIHRSSQTEELTLPRAHPPSLAACCPGACVVAAAAAKRKATAAAPAAGAAAPGGTAPSSAAPAAPAPAAALPPPVEAAPNKLLFVQNLPAEASELMVSMLFQQFPGYKEVRMVEQKPGIAFVEFEHEMQSGVAMQGLQGFKITPTNSMAVSYARH